jgi:hypothetical protein
MAPAPPPSDEPLAPVAVSPGRRGPPASHDRDAGSVDAATAPTVCSGATMTYAAVLVLLLGLLLIRGGASRLQAGSVRR